MEPLEYVNLSLKSPIPIQLDWFWTYSKNKEALQISSRQFLINKSKEGTKIVLSGYVTDAEGSQDCIEVYNGWTAGHIHLNSVIEEADSQMVPHIASAIKDECNHVIFVSNDTDILVY